MKKSRIIMLLGVLLMSGLYLFPLWNITLEAPQYPVPLGMDIHINKFADTHEFDIKNINLMNHYVGMKEIPETIPELKIFPVVVGIMIVIGIAVGFTGKHRLFLLFFIAMAMLSLIAVYDFYLWEYDYGHNLNPKAIMNFQNPDGSPMGFQPPLFGTKDILNFTAHSYPRTGTYFMLSGMVLIFVSFFVGKREAKRKLKKELRTESTQVDKEELMLS